MCLHAPDGKESRNCQPLKKAYRCFLRLQPPRTLARRWPKQESERGRERKRAGELTGAETRASCQG